MFEHRTYFAPSALVAIVGFLPRALPWAFTFRAFGAEHLSVYPPAIAGGTNKRAAAPSMR